MPEAATTTTPPTNPDAALLVGGPAGDHGKEMPKHGDPHPEAGKNQPPKYELNGKTFKSPEEMSKYVADLEKKVIEQPLVSQIQPQAQPPKAPQIVIDGLTLDQLMFANPERYHQYVQEQAEKRVDQKLQVIENRKNFWNNFYTDNPDLRGKEDFVDMLVQKNWTEWEKKPVGEFAKVVADSSRSMIKKLGVNATEVKQSAAATLSPSGETAPQIQVQRQETSFVDELKMRRTKKAK